MTNARLDAGGGGRIIQPGALPAAPGIPGPPLMYWYIAYHVDEPTKAEKALLDGIDRFIDDTMQQEQAALIGLGLDKKQEPMRRLAFYLNKPATYADAVDNQMRVQQANAAAQATGGPQQAVPPIYSWETQRAYFPWDYEQDWADFQDLRARAAKGEFSKASA